MRPLQLGAMIGMSLGLALAACGGGSEGGGAGAGPPESAITGPMPTTGELLFVVRGSGSVTGTKLASRGEAGRSEQPGAERTPRSDAQLRGTRHRVEVKADAVEWFTDRPQRKAGIAAAHELVDRWKTYGFDKDPPNAALTAPGTDAVVDLQQPQKTPEGIAFEAIGIRGELPTKRHEYVSLFVDSTGPRGDGGTADDDHGGWSLSPETFDFGEVPKGGSKTSTFTLSGFGSWRNYITSIKASDPFNVSENDCGPGVPGSDACTITVTFAPPDSPGSWSGQLKVETKTEYEPSASLRGEAP